MKTRLVGINHVALEVGDVDEAPASGRQAGTGLLTRTDHWKDTTPPTGSFENRVTDKEHRHHPDDSPRRDSRTLTVRKCHPRCGATLGRGADPVSHLRLARIGQDDCGEKGWKPSTARCGSRQTSGWRRSSVPATTRRSVPRSRGCSGRLRSECSVLELASFSNRGSCRGRTDAISRESRRVGCRFEADLSRRSPRSAYRASCETECVATAWVIPCRGRRSGGLGGQI
jgi:hypothetical protein